MAEESRAALLEATMTNDTERDTRSQYVAGLRALADAIEQDPALRLPFQGSASPFSIYPKDRAELLGYVGLLTEALPPKVDESARRYGFRIDGRIHRLAVAIAADLDVAGDASGERVVTTYAIAPELATLAATA